MHRLSPGPASCYRAIAARLGPAWMVARELIILNTGPTPLPVLWVSFW